MMRVLSISEKYEAQGFVEALIAILVTGIAAVGLMLVTARTIGEVARNEILDQLTQEAVKGASLMDYYIEEWNQGNRSVVQTNLLVEGDTFTNNVSRCFALDGTFDNLHISPTPVLGCTHHVSNVQGQTQAIEQPAGINPSACLSGSNSNEIAIDIDDERTGIDHRDKMFRVICVSPESDSSGYVMVAKIYTGLLACEDYDRNVTQLRDTNEACSVYQHTAVYTVEP